MVDLWALRAQAVEPGAGATPSMNLAHLIMVLYVDLFWHAEAIYGTTSKLRSSRRHSFCSDFDFGLSLQEGSPAQRKRTLRTCVRHRYADFEAAGTAMGFRGCWRDLIPVWHAHPQVWHGLGAKAAGFGCDERREARRNPVITHRITPEISDFYNSREAKIGIKIRPDSALI